MKWFFLACSGLREPFTMDHSFIWLPSVTRKKFLDPSLKKVIKYFVVSLDMKFGCNVMYVCLLSWLGHTLALWFAKQDFLKKMTHGPKGVSKSAKKSICKQCLGGHETDIISSLPKTPWSPDFSSPAASLISSSCTLSSTLWITAIGFASRFHLGSEELQAMTLFTLNDFNFLKRCALL